MARSSTSNRNSQSGGAGRAETNPRVLRPGMVTLAAVFLWAARHEPADFSAASLVVWFAGAITAALLVRAALALAAPLLAIAGAALEQAIASLRSGDEP